MRDIIRQPLTDGEFVIEPTQGMRNWEQIDIGTVHIFGFRDPHRTECGMQLNHVTWFHPTGGIPFATVCGVCVRAHEQDIYAHLTLQVGARGAGSTVELPE